MVNTSNQYDTMLISAVLQNDAESSKALLSKASGVNVTDKYGNTPLMYAAYNGNLDLVRFFVDRGADVNKKNTVDGATALMYCVRHGHFDVARLLLAQGSDTSSVTSQGWNALNYAVHKNDISMAELLLQYNASPNAKDNLDLQWTALLHAMDNRDVDMIELLLYWGACPNVQDRDGWTPVISMASAKGDFEKDLRILEMLRAHNADFGIKNNRGQNALSIAKLHGYEEIIPHLEEMQNRLQ